MLYNFDVIPGREKTDCTKWDARMRDYGDDTLLPFSIADMDFPALPEVITALEDRVRHGVFGYTFAGKEYFDRVIQWYKRRHDVLLSESGIVNFPCVLTALSCSIDALTARGDGVMINPPVYYPFYSLISDRQRTAVLSPLMETSVGYRLDFADIENKLRVGNVKLYLLCSPHNPVGRVWTRDELKQLVDLCKEYNVLILSDEIHSDLILAQNSHSSILSIPGAEDCSLAAYAPSKTFNIAGLKSSTVFSKNADLVQRVRDAGAKYHLSINLFGYTATQAAYTYGDRWLDELLPYLRGNAEFICESLRQTSIQTYVPQGTYLMWLDFRAYGLKQPELMNRIQNKAGLALDDGAIFGKEGNGFARLNIGTSRALLQKAAERLIHEF